MVVVVGDHFASPGLCDRSASVTSRKAWRDCCQQGVGAQVAVGVAGQERHWPQRWRLRLWQVVCAWLAIGRRLSIRPGGEGSEKHLDARPYIIQAEAPDPLTAL